jgi:hypothetical protein
MGPDLLEHDDVVEQEGQERRWRDDAARIFVGEITRLIAARLGQGDAPEREMWFVLDGIPMCVVLEAADRLGVVVRCGVWRIRRGPEAGATRPPPL